MTETNDKCIYGPVDSWRLGRSLGVDLLFIDSICSFACVYCQLGKINRITTDREVFVPTARVLDDLRASKWKNSDVITFSGSGEPTLASNLGETIAAIRELTGKPIAVLTNATLLDRQDVRGEIQLADKIFCKLDAWSEPLLQRIDRPAAGITLEGIVEGIRQLRSQYSGFLAIQTMLVSEPSQKEIETYAKIVRSIGPDEVEINLPLRPIPNAWNLESRGNITELTRGSRKLKTLSGEQAASVGEALARLTNIKVITPFERTDTTSS